MNVRQEVNEYIKNRWQDTIHSPEEKNHGIIRLPRPYSVPCANVKDMYTDFFYWDTYFTNLGFLADGHADQVENNLDIMDYFIRNLGYVPNSNYLTDRSQPPLFSRGVWDLYQYTGEKRILEKYIYAMEKEYEFFQLDRNTPCGLNGYDSEILRSRAKDDYSWLSERVKEFRDTVDEQVELIKDLMAIAESGWDFNPRFDMEGHRFASREFAHLDLNCLLYDVEQILSQIHTIFGNEEKAKRYQQSAKERKEKMEQLMVNSENGIFYDYNYKENVLSPIGSCASFYPYAVGISDDREAAKKLLEKLELEHGISACEYRGENVEYLQWDYPSMWPSNVYFCYTGLKRIGLNAEADRIAEKYMNTVERCFEQSGALWEKYDAKQGTVSVTSEYDTPEMMGWTAGVYRFLAEK